jgi:hypothetical protein
MPSDLPATGRQLQIGAADLIDSGNGPDDVATGEPRELVAG